jgi:hypothetical protein
VLEHLKQRVGMMSKITETEVTQLDPTTFEVTVGSILETGGHVPIEKD